MPVTIVNPNALVSKKEAVALWQATRDVLSLPDMDVSISIVSLEDIQQLNKQYRSHNKPTNVLTFSYDQATHDIALCLEIAEKEAHQLKIDLPTYSAWLLTHAFLHVAGLDHEESAEEEAKMKVHEKDVMHRSGFTRPAIY